MVSFKGNSHSREYWPWWRFVLVGLNGIALALCIILSLHYLKGEPMVGCGGGSSCEQVLNSRWSMIGGILPVISLALGAYLAMLVTSFFIGASTPVEIRRLAWNVLLLLVGSIAGSAIWFIIVQKWFIKEFCFYCMTLHITGLLLTILVIWRAIRIAHKGFDDSLSTSPKKVQDISQSNQPSIIHTIGMVLIGVIMSGILAASQSAFASKATYYSGKSQDNLPDIDYNNAPIIGSSDAPYVVKVLFDYQCPHCQKIHFMLSEAVGRYGGKLAFVLCPTPLSTQCNPYIPRDVEAFKNSCELARIALAIWVANHKAFTSFENWMFTYESGDKWHSRSIEATRAKAVELVGEEKFNEAFSSDWVERYMQTCIQIYAQTIQGGKGAIPKLVFGTHWVIPEPNNDDDLIMILQKSLAVPKP